VLCGDVAAFSGGRLQPIPIKSELVSGLTRSEAGSEILDPGCAGEDEDVFA
jgi:hypothetical protein